MREMNIKDLFPHRKIWAAVGLIVIFAIVVAFALNLKRSYDGNLAKAATDSQNLALAVEHHAAATIQKTDLVLNRLVDEFSPGYGDKWLNPQSISSYLLALRLKQPELKSLLIVRADGDVLYSLMGGGDAAPPLSLADEVYFADHRDKPKLGLNLFKPTQGRGDSGRNLILSRRLSNPDGSFAGIAAATISLTHFEDFYGSLDLGKNGSLTLLNEKLTILARYPAGDGFRGKSLMGSQLEAHRQKTPRSGAFSGASPEDGVERLFSFRQVGDLPLYVNVGLAEQDFLGEWRRNALTDSAVMVALLVIALFLPRGRRAEASLNPRRKAMEPRVAEEAARIVEQERALMQRSCLAATSEMVGNISQRWRQPLNALDLMFANIKDAQKFHELDPQILVQSTVEGRRIIHEMFDAIDDFRSFFKPDKEKATFSVNDGLQAAIEILSDSLCDHNIKIQVEAGEELVAYGFPGVYSQVLLNVLSHARDALVANNVADGVIHIGIARIHDQASVIVRDNAGGISDEILAGIFEPGFTIKHKRAGVGLYLSKMIIKSSMDGDIEAGNVEGGTEFVVTCPVAKALRLIDG